MISSAPAYDPRARNSLINSRNNFINLRDNRVRKLEQLEAYLSATASIYDTAEAELIEAERLLMRIEMTVRCADIQTVIMPPLMHVDVEILISKLLPHGAEPNWVMIEEMLGRSVTTPEIIALAHVFLDLPNDRDVERFISLGYALEFTEGTGVGYYVLTDTFRDIIRVVESVVTPIALATVWSDPPLIEFSESEIRRYIERMQTLQVTSAVGDRLQYIGHMGDAYITARVYEASPVPVRLGVDENGNKTIQVATHLISPPGEFAAKHPPVRLGVEGTTGTIEGTSTVNVDLANYDTHLNYVGFQVGEDWNWAQSVASGTLNVTSSGLRNYLIKSLFTNTASGAAAVATSGVSVVISVADSYTAHQSAVRAAIQSIEEYDFYFHINRLGAMVNYTNIHGQTVVHGISYNNPGARQVADRFICCQGIDRNMTPEWLRRIILSGDRSNQTYIDYMEFIDINRHVEVCCDDCGW